MRALSKIVRRSSGILLPLLVTAACSGQPPEEELAGGAQAEGNVTPDVDVTLLPGQSISLDKQVVVPEVPPKLDLYLVVDLSGSYSDDLPNLMAKAPDIFDGVRAGVADSRFGLGSIVDYPFSPWGDAGTGDYAYRIDQDLTADRTTWLTATGAMMTRFGGDGPQSQLEAFYQAAAGAGRDLNGNGSYADLGDVPPAAVSFRADATKIVALTTDAPFHQPGDPGDLPGGYPGPSRDATVAALGAAGIKVIAIKAPGSSTEMDDIAGATGGAVTTTDASSSQIAEAILGALQSLKFTITGVPVGCGPLSVSLAQASYSGIEGGTTVIFSETITAPSVTSGGDIQCQVIFYADSTEIGRQNIHAHIGVAPVDIKPGSCPNPFQMKNRGVLPVALLGTASFDVGEVDPATVRLEGVPPLRYSLGDVATPFEPYYGKAASTDCTTGGTDGFVDMNLKFSHLAVAATLGAVSDREARSLKLTGLLRDGSPFVGEDIVLILANQDGPAPAR